ncbi:TRAP transporter small permease [Seohaeicola zhoushanensis]|uniref:TRAP transporter small permease protein n=1 Tax=Seohaeicola zhoushanensis TaxID=1569283 RepID=A0A8J3H3K9_9RHOB|nr:TRAP transporter small permease [Seohaeicola zhoushanensis]GHF72188.1 hypothetical protein GCM10017056_48940 [Seohaeicola zhoushanensis]
MKVLKPVLSLAGFAETGAMLVSALSLFAMMLLTLTDVTTRSLFSAPVYGGAEVTQILLATSVFLAMPSISLRDGHVSVDLFDFLFPERIRSLRDAVISTGVGVALTWPAVVLVHHAQRSMSYNETTLFLQIPVFWILYLIAAGVAASAALLILRGLVLLIDGPDGAVALNDGAGGAQS